MATMATPNTLVVTSNYDSKRAPCYAEFIKKNIIPDPAKDVLSHAFLVRTLSSSSSFRDIQEKQD